MKKYLLLITLGLCSFLMVNAQKENGTVYSEHEAIGKTRGAWAAFVKGDKEAFISVFADTVRMDANGTAEKKLKKEMAGYIDWWQGFDNLSVTDDTPAFPDAINYTKGGLWVQDWLRVKGIHKNTGVQIDFPIHNLYSFNKAGKIQLMIQYYKEDFLNEINNSGRTIENGTVYINHPYIVTVRKLVNAYCAEDINTWKSFYDPKATFWRSDFKELKEINLDEETKGTMETFSDFDNIKLKQVGYPDCIYYSRDDNYTVYSWWLLSYTTKDAKKKSDIPVMVSDDFNKEGKIYRQMLYRSTNHFD